MIPSTILPAMFCPEMLEKVACIAAALLYSGFIALNCTYRIFIVITILLE